MPGQVDEGKAMAKYDATHDAAYDATQITISRNKIIGLLDIN
jgi:hypothetical protein